MNYKQTAISVQGKVQGVFFRMSTQEQALVLGIKGWVKNEPNGNVSILAQGTEQSLQLLIAWCKVGPSGAIVTTVTSKEQPVDDLYSTFEIKRT